MRKALIGFTSYLNCRPIYHGLDPDLPVILAPPQELISLLLNREIDFAQISLWDYLSNQKQLELYDRFWVIASGVEIRSVLLLTNQPLECFHGLSTVYLSTESVTANQLCKVMLEGRFQKRPVYQPKLITSADLALLEQTDLPCGLTLIGDKALEVWRAIRHEHQYPGLHLYDLQRLWRVWMQLPFVFAVFASWRLIQPNEEDIFREIHSNLIRNLQYPQAFLNLLPETSFSSTFLEEYYNLLSYTPTVNDWDAIFRFSDLGRNPLLSRASRLTGF